jgi:hypothetical protein
MKAVKLTSKKLTTYGNFQWVPMEWRVANKNRLKQCSESALHCYPTARIAMFMEISSSYLSASLFHQCEVDESRAFRCDGTEIYAKRMRLLDRQITPPVITREQRVRIAVRMVDFVIRKRLPRSLRSRWNAWVKMFSVENFNQALFESTSELEGLMHEILPYVPKTRKAREAREASCLIMRGFRYLLFYEDKLEHLTVQIVLKARPLFENGDGFAFARKLDRIIAEEMKR